MTNPRSVLLLAVLTMVLSGCVMREEYEAQKSRALNFQRLLAQEEKRTGELDAEVKRLKQELPELEARNRELTAQLQAVREQLGRVQEETAALRAAAAVEAEQEAARAGKTKETKRPKGLSQTPPPTIEVDKGLLGDLGMDLPKDVPKSDRHRPLYHDVKRGDTLFKLSRLYGVRVDQIKDWNQLDDSTIEIGQKLIVGYQ